MFDAATAELIRAAPALSGVDPVTLPQELTRVYSDIVVLRLKGAAIGDDPDQLRSLQRLKRIADIYEGAVDAGAEGDARRAAAFVAATRINCLGASC
jgi:ATP-dependent RNA helicase HelY